MTYAKSLFLVLIVFAYILCGPALLAYGIFYTWLSVDNTHAEYVKIFIGFDVTVLGLAGFISTICCKD